MSKIDSDRFRFVKFQKSKSRNAKYDAIIEDVKTLRKQTIPFGDNSYQQYRDDTGLKIYSRLDHNDKKRKASYLARHEKTRYKKWSASWFSSVFLWNGPRS